MTKEISVRDKAEVTKLGGFSTVEDMLKWATTVIDSGLLPNAISQPEEVVAIVIHGQELGLKPMVALNNLHVISGRVTLSSAIMGSLLKQRGVEWIYLEDFEKIKDDDGNIEFLDEGKTIPNRRTTIKYFWKSINTGMVMEATHAVTWSQMSLAGYVSKDNWQRYPKEMMRARCSSYGIRALFPEILSGFYTDLEMNDVDPQSAAISVDDEGEIVIEVNSEN